MQRKRQEGDKVYGEVLRKLCEIKGDEACLQQLQKRVLLFSSEEEKTKFKSPDTVHAFSTKVDAAQFNLDHMPSFRNVVASKQDLKERHVQSDDNPRIGAAAGFHGAVGCLVRLTKNLRLPKGIFWVSITVRWVRLSTLSTKNLTIPATTPAQAPTVVVNFPE